MAKNYVCNGAKIECMLCTLPEGELKVTSNTVKVQDKLFANANDKERENLVFQGNCKKSPAQAHPCQMVINTGDWENIADLVVQDAPALLEDSTIKCNYGGVAIKITDHLQINEIASFQPVTGPFIEPIFEPEILSLEWKSNKEGKKKGKTTDAADKVIEKTIVQEKVWLEAQTMGILPGEKLRFELTEEQENGTVTLEETSATVQTDGTAMLQLKTKDSEAKNYKINAKAIYDDNTTAEAKVEILPLPKVIVDFRPSKNYDGEYGFDYMRHKKEKDDHVTYIDILGTNREYDKKNKKWIDKFKKYPTDTKYNSLKDDHYDTTTFPWHKDVKGNEIEYIQSWLTIYPKDKATVSLQINTLEGNTQDLKLEYDKTLFQLNTDIVPAQKKGKKRLKDHLTIECLKEFGTDQTIKVMLGSTQFGQLNILANAKAKRKKAQVVFVKVNTQLFSGTIKKGKTTGEDAFLKKYLNQAYIKPNIIEEVLDLTADTTFNKTFDTKSNGYIDNRTGLHDYLNKKVDVKYKDYLKVYFIPDECPSFNKAGVKVGRVNGQAKDIPSDAVVLFDGHNTSTTTHESLHALGLYHTFSSDKGNPYSYKKGETYNIMDYSHQSKYGSKKRIITWLWQWKKLWANNLIKSE